MHTFYCLTPDGDTLLNGFLVDECYPPIFIHTITWTIISVNMLVITTLLVMTCTMATMITSTTTITITTTLLVISESKYY
jgi:hypothetical protein